MCPGVERFYRMVTLRTKVLAVVFVLGIAATGVTLAAGITNTGGLGVADVEQEPLQVDEIDADEDITFASDNGEVAEVNQFTTAEGASVFDVDISGIDGGNEFSVTTPVNNTADSSLYLTLDVETSDDISFVGVTDDRTAADRSGLGDTDIVSVSGINDGNSETLVAEFSPAGAPDVFGDDQGDGFNAAELTFDFRVDNDAAANDLHEFEINFEFEERSPGQT